MDKPEGAKRYKKELDDGWKCPVCTWWFCRYASTRHLQQTHPDEYAALLAQARARTPLLARYPEVWAGPDAA